MKDKKCKITIEFQAENEAALKLAVRYIDKDIGAITRMSDITATIDYPEKYNPYAKS